MKVTKKPNLKDFILLLISFFRSALTNSPQAQDYLKEKRNLTSDIIEHFQIGYAPDKHYELIQFFEIKRIF